MSKSAEAPGWDRATPEEMTTTPFLAARRGLDVRRYATADGSVTYTAVDRCRVCGAPFGSDALLYRPALRGTLSCGRHG